ncbi:Arc family DNA-binding protein [Pseudovibrio exalbescens]|uniref:Arc family DNA-binding protein n=1 Tax=Pseudovibrio exalbescens TaxID=197461 RepID=UPI000C9C5EB7|nr:Arc family DNA-binding protein [Pseudovibrio exalbescens]
MSDSTKAKNKEQFVVRLPDGMRERIASAAKDNNRSMNAEIVARLEDAFSSSRLPDYILNLVDRFKWAISQINAASYDELSVSMVAEGISEASAERLEQVFEGSAYPPFELTDRVARFLNVRSDWLKHGQGHPYEVGSQTTYGAQLAEKLISERSQSVAFVRCMSREGNMAIIQKLDNFVYKAYSTDLSLSDVVGGSGERNLASFSNTCRRLYLGQTSFSTSGYLLDQETFFQLMQGEINPMLALKKAQPSYWYSDWWDPKSFNQKTSDEGYWEGFTELCKRVYNNLELNDKLRAERDEIVGG